MPVGRIFGDLSVFDLLGNFVPGVVLMASVVLFLPTDRAIQLANSPLAAVLVLGVVSFIAGHLIQSYAAEAVGERETFRNSILTHQTYGNSPILNYEEHPSAHPILYDIYERLYWGDIEHWAASDFYEPDERKESVENEIPQGKLVHERLCGIIARPYRSVVEAVFLVRIKRDYPLDQLTLVVSVWEVCAKKYDLSPNEYDEWGDLLHLMSSDIESNTTNSRAFRFQAMRNFYRGMWITCLFSSALFFGTVLLQHFPGFSNWVFSLVGISTWTPFIRDVWEPIWVIGLGFLALQYLFWELKEKFEDEFVEYLITDFLAANDDLIQGEMTDDKRTAKLSLIQTVKKALAGE
jgi:hypothetical protein